jgi:hypothetical protein
LHDMTLKPKCLMLLIWTFQVPAFENRDNRPQSEVRLFPHVSTGYVVHCGPMQVLWWCEPPISDDLSVGCWWILSCTAARSCRGASARPRPLGHGRRSKEQRTLGRNWWEFWCPCVWSPA